LPGEHVSPEIIHALLQSLVRKALCRCLAALGALGLNLAVPAIPAHAQFGGVVFDPSNYAQNILAATRALKSVNQQIQQPQTIGQFICRKPLFLRHSLP